MGITDIILMAAILSGAGYLFFRSFIKKKGCSSCSSSSCPVKSVTAVTSKKHC